VFTPKRFAHVLKLGDGKVAKFLYNIARKLLQTKIATLKILAPLTLDLIRRDKNENETIKMRR